MTPVELAGCLNVARQTVNRWIREQKWRTEKIPGVKGGRARVVIIDKQVLDFLTNLPQLHALLSDLQLAEPTAHYFVNNPEIIWRQLAEILHHLSVEEQQRLLDLLVREGITGFLSRLDIASKI